MLNLLIILISSSFILGLIIGFISKILYVKHKKTYHVDNTRFFDTDTIEEQYHGKKS